MKKLIYALLTLFLAAAGGSVQAQTMPLDQLLKLGALPAGLPLQKMTAALFPPEWSYRGHVERTEETYWTANATDYEFDAETEKPLSWVSLRPMPNGSVDVLFKTFAARNIEPLRKELKRLKLPVEPVTCLECEGERYLGPGYTVTVYSGKKGPFPFILVLHQTPVVAEPARPVQLATPIPSAPAATDTPTSAATPIN